MTPLRLLALGYCIAAFVFGAALVAEPETRQRIADAARRVARRVWIA